MSYPIYYVEEGDTLPHLFDTFDGGTGASVTMTGLAITDIEIYKDGSATQRASDAGYTLLDTDGIDFDGITGIHGFSIDLSNNTDTGFYAVGSWYHVVVSSITVDGQTVNFVACAFRIVSATRGMAGTALPNAAADAAGGLPISDAGGLDMDAILADTADMQPKLGTITDLGSGTTIGANLADIEAQTDDIGAAGAGLTAIPWNAAWDAEVQSEVADGIAAAEPIDANLVQIDGAATNGNNATLNLAQLNIVNSGGSAIVASSTGGNGHGIAASGNGSGEGVSATGGSSGHGIEAIGGSGTGIGIYARGQASPNGEGMRIDGAGSSSGLRLNGGSSGGAGLLVGASSNGNGVQINGSGSGHGMSVTGGATGNGIQARGGATSGNGIDAAATTSGDGMQLAGAGGGLDLDATTTDSLEVNATGGAPTAAAIADAVWDEATSGHTTSGTFGEQLKTDVDAILDDTGTSGVAISSSTQNSIADALLKRDWTAVTGEAARSVLNALRFLRNKWSISGTTLTVTKEDDSTSAWTGTVTTDAAADPVTGNDPT